MKEILSKPRYRTPSFSVEVDVFLDQFGFDQIVAYLRHHGYQVAGEGVGLIGVDEVTADGLLITPKDLSHIETLAVCGQKQPARDLALGIISDALGRVL